MYYSIRTHIIDRYVRTRMHKVLTYRYTRNRLIRFDQVSIILFYKPERETKAARLGIYR